MDIRKSQAAKSDPSFMKNCSQRGFERRNVYMNNERLTGDLLNLRACLWKMVRLL